MNGRKSLLVKELRQEKLCKNASHAFWKCVHSIFLYLCLNFQSFAIYLYILVIIHTNTTFLIFPVYLYYMYTCVCKHICECVCMREWSLHFIRYHQTHTHVNTNTSMRVHAHHVKKIPLPEAKWGTGSVKVRCEGGRRFCHQANTVEKMEAERQGAVSRALLFSGKNVLCSIY